MRLSSPSFLRLPFLRLAGAAGVVALLAACGGDQPAAPTAPRITLSVGDPGIASRISEEIAAILADRPREKQASQHFLQVQDFVAKGDLAGARNMVRIMDAELLQQFNAGGLVDTDGVGGKTTAWYLAVLLNDLDAYVGLSTAPPPSSSAFVVLVNPSPNEQVFPVTYGGLGDEGAVFIVPPNATTRSALLTIDRNETGAQIPVDLTKLSKLYEVHFSPTISFTNVLFGVCILPPDEAYAGNARLAHQVSATQVDILPLAAHSPYVCDNDPPPPPIGLNEATSFRGFALVAGRAARRALRVFEPSVAYAGHAAILGSVSTLSPFQVVLTRTSLSVVDTVVDYAATGGPAVTLSMQLSVLRTDDRSPLPLAGQMLGLTVDGTPYPGALTADGSKATEPVGTARWYLTALSYGIHSYTVTYSDPNGVYGSSTYSNTFTISPPIEVPGE